MKRCLVTGAAGFIGSHLSRHLLAKGFWVRGVDCFTEHYDYRLKERNLRDLLLEAHFSLVIQDIALNPRELVQDIDLIFHHAAQAGARESWGEEFDLYLYHNILATQRLLEAACEEGVERFIFASSSAVYGETRSAPSAENDLPRPLSPYGVSKLAAEHLCRLFYDNYALPVTILRYFTVYGPAQRPDMAFHRFARALLAEEELVVYGSGEQTRDFTYIDDAVAASLAAATTPAAVGKIYNIGGGSRASINQVIQLMEGITGKKARIKRIAAPAGDTGHTCADTGRAREELGFFPSMPLQQGLAAQLADLEKILQEGL